MILWFKRMSVGPKKADGRVGGGPVHWGVGAAARNVSTP